MQPEKQTEEIQKGIQKIKGKMKIQNFNNLQPPFFPHTATKFREIFLSQFLKDINIDDPNPNKLRNHLKIVHYIIENFDDECMETYASQLIQPYTKKMFQDNYGMESIDFKEANSKYHLKIQIEEALSNASQWFTQIEITQDLLSRIELYFKIKCPNIIQRVREEGFDNQKNTWYESVMSGIKRLMTFGLRKGSKTIQSAFFTSLAPTALMLTLAIMGGSASIPWKTDIDYKKIIASLAIITLPQVLEMMAGGIQKSDIAVTLKKAAIVFSELSESIGKFNQILQQLLRNCTISGNIEEFVKEKTNLQKVLLELKSNISLVMNFDEAKIQEMRERTEAYFREYVEIQEGQWTVVFPKNAENQNNSNLKPKPEDQDFKEL